jgi:hypothetical protein
MKINKTNNLFFYFFFENNKSNKFQEQNKDHKKHKNKLELLPGNGAKIWRAVVSTQK